MKGCGRGSNEGAYTEDTLSLNTQERTDVKRKEQVQTDVQTESQRRPHPMASIFPVKRRIKLLDENGQEQIGGARRLIKVEEV